MTRITIKLLCLLALISAISCKKKEKSLRDKIIGTWKITHAIDDINNNGIADDPIQNMAAYNESLIFHSNGIVDITANGIIGSSIKWSVSDRYLVLTRNGSNTGEGQLITSGPDTAMTIKSTSVEPARFTVMSKQN